MENLNELSKNTLKSYVKKSSDEIAIRASGASSARARGDNDEARTHRNKLFKRRTGLNKATDKLEEELQPGELRFFYTIDGADKGQYIDATSRSEAIQKVMDKTGKKPTTIELATDDQPKAIKENFTPFVIAALSDNGVDATEVLQTALSDRMLKALAEKKQEIAANLFGPIEEATEQLDELKTSTVASYAEKAKADQSKQTKNAEYHRGQQAKHEKSYGPSDSSIAATHGKAADKAERKEGNRERGQVQARKRLTPAETVSEAATKVSQHYDNKVDKRLKGISKATDKL